jgi:methylthioribose-1-phosphate isomerase
MRRSPASARTHPLNADSPQHKLRIETVEIRADAVVLIDQLALPADERYVTCATWRDVAERIRDMTVRGAPAIGVAAAGALALAAREAVFSGGGRAAFDAALSEAAAGLAQTRPTAVNLTWAIAEMRALWQRCDAAPDECWLTLLARAREIHDDDIRRCYAIGAFGAPLFAAGAAILTHCNAGALATAGYGTALGVIRSCHERYGGAVSVFVDETRPWLQGARLTAWELGVEGIEYSVISDNMAGHFISRGEVDGIVVGADRIAANGDTANKIGTYTLSVLAKEHGVPFYVAAPLSTVDLAVAGGADIPIEERDPAEVTHFRGSRVTPAGAHARHPAFDVTPQANISAIITEVDVLRAPYDQALRLACLKGECTT